MQAWQQDREVPDVQSLLDKHLGGAYSLEEAVCMWKTAVQCINHVARSRPGMEQVCSCLACLACFVLIEMSLVSGLEVVTGGLTYVPRC